MDATTAPKRWLGRMVTAALALAALAFVGSCSFDFLNDDDTDTEETTYHYTHSDDDTIMYCWDQEDVLQWYEVYAYTGEDLTRKDRYSADDELQYTYLYGWEGGRKTVVAYFDAEGTLRWYDHYVYDGELLAQLCDYDGSGSLQWFAVYEYSASGKTTLTAKYDGQPGLQYAYTWEYDASDCVVTEKTYDENGLLTAKTTHEWNAECKEVRSVTYEAPASSASLVASVSPTGASSRAAELVLPTPDDPPAIPVLTLTDQDLEVASRRFWFYDGYGTTDVTTTANYLPTKVVRVDSRIDEDVSVSLTYDEADRPLSKTTCYGATEALKIVLTYAEESGYEVSHIQTTGAALLLPLDFDLSYDDNGVPTEVVISEETTTLFTVTYTYDPANLLEHTVTVVDGNDELWSEYVFELAADYLSATITVYTDYEHTQQNGYYALAYNEDERTLSFASFDASGNPVVRYEYGYQDLQGLAEQAVMVLESKFGFDAESEYAAIMEKIEGGDFDVTALLRIRSAEDVVKLFL